MKWSRICLIRHLVLLELGCCGSHCLVVYSDDLRVNGSKESHNYILNMIGMVRTYGMSYHELALLFPNWRGIKTKMSIIPEGMISFYQLYTREPLHILLINQTKSTVHLVYPGSLLPSPNHSRAHDKNDRK